MAISEQQRFEMHLGLRQQLGDDVASTLMEHLPPSGWGDVARVHDIQRIESEITHVREQLGQIKNSVRVLIGGILTVSAAIIVLLIQQNQNIS